MRNDVQPFPDVGPGLVGRRDAGGQFQIADHQCAAPVVGDDNRFLVDADALRGFILHFHRRRVFARGRLHVDGQREGRYPGLLGADLPRGSFDGTEAELLVE